MHLLNSTTRPVRAAQIVAASALLGLFVIVGAAVHGQQVNFKVLLIGSTNAGPESNDKKKEEAALVSLKGFIKEETGFDNEIVRFKDWRELVDKMTKKEIQLGVFQGYEFAWATEKTADLQPLAAAVNVYEYPVAYVVVKKTSAAKDFSGLQGQAVAIPNTGQPFLKIFVDKECQDRGKASGQFFSKMTTPDNVEDALDDVVDGVLQVVVADRTGLEAYKRRKPGRFAQLKEIAHSQKFPPPIVAYYKGVLDGKTLMRFQVGLLQARNKEKGQTMLTLFKLTGFDKTPPDFDQVLAQTRKNYPPDLTAK